MVMFLKGMVRALWRSWEGWHALVILLMMVIVTVDVICRVIYKPLGGVIDLVTIGMVFLWGAVVVTTYRRNHAAVEMLLMKLSRRRIKAGLKNFSDVANLGVVAVICTSTLMQVMKVKEGGKVYLNCAYIDIPISILWWYLGVSCLLLTVVALWIMRDDQNR